jgi:hypothetical protein
VGVVTGGKIWRSQEEFDQDGRGGWPAGVRRRKLFTVEAGRRGEARRWALWPVGDIWRSQEEFDQDRRGGRPAGARPRALRRPASRYSNSFLSSHASRRSCYMENLPVSYVVPSAAR